MPVPFNIQYTRALRKSVSGPAIAPAMDFIKEFINQQTGDDILIDGNTVSYSVNFFRIRWRHNAMIAVDKGVFTLVNDGNISVLKYRFLMYRFWGMLGAFSVLAGFFMHTFFISLFFLFVFGGIVVTATAARHRQMLNEIASNIDLLPDLQNQIVPERKEVEILQPEPEAPMTSVSSNMSIVLFYGALIGWLASLAVHVLSVFHNDVSEKFPIVWGLHLGIIGIYLLAIVELKKMPVFKDKLVLNSPLKVVKILAKGVPVILIVIAVAGFIYFQFSTLYFIMPQNGMQAFQNGAPVPSDLKLQQASSIRGFSGAWVAFYGLGLVALYPFKYRHMPAKIQ